MTTGKAAGGEAAAGKAAPSKPKAKRTPAKKAAPKKGAPKKATPAKAASKKATAAKPAPEKAARTKPEARKPEARKLEAGQPEAGEPAPQKPGASDGAPPAEVTTARFAVDWQAPPAKVPGPPTARTSEEYTLSESAPPVPESPTEAFDQLYELHAHALTRQAFLLCGHRRLAERGVEWAFHRAWERWPEVAVDSDPLGWVRAQVYAYALSPWHQLLPTRRWPEAYAGPPADRALLNALLKLPRTYRAALLLYDGLGLNLPDTAAETEASTGAAASRITHARAALAQSWPELRETPERERGALLTRRLRELAAAQPVRTSPPHLVRRGSEHTTRDWTRASVGLTAAVVAATTFTLVTAEDPAAPHEEPRSRPSAPPSPGASGVVPESARPSAPRVPAAPSASRSGRALPGPADPAAATHAYLPQLRSTNARMHLDDFRKPKGPEDSTDTEDATEDARGTEGTRDTEGSSGTEDTGDHGATEGTDGTEGTEDAKGPGGPGDSGGLNRAGGEQESRAYAR